MSPKEFAGGLYSAIVDENIVIYRDLFINTEISEVTDPYWTNALSLFKSLSVEQQKVFFSIIKQIIVDTTSNVLGVIDGVNAFNDENFLIYRSGSSKPLSGDLQGLFLLEEDTRSKEG